MIRRLLDLLPPVESGGLIPLARVEHQRSVVDGSSVKVRVTWLRVGASVKVDLPFGSLNPDHEPSWRPW